ncbi:hypothetical protein [Nonomuraea sp. NPDC046570]|uniref:hypothetical protein n=1 Tax=Nonomuraea sp. NPDC046570 TaxID=3155255 RepID=UPI0034050E14
MPYLEAFEPEDVSEALRACDPRARAALDAFAAELAEESHARLPHIDFGRRIQRGTT